MRQLKTIIFITIFLISSILIFDVDALTIGRVTYDAKVNIRTGPGSNYSKTGTLSYNDTIVLLNNKPIASTSACPNGWYKFRQDEINRYICSDYISTSTYTIKTNTSQVKIRDGAGTEYEIYKTMPSDKLLTLSSTKKYDGTGCSSGWYKLNYNGSKDKYVCSKYTDSYNSKSNIIITNSTGANIREKATSTSKKITNLKYGQVLTLYEIEKHKGTGCSNDWYKILYNNSINYICSNLVTNKNTTSVINYDTGVNIREKASSTSKIITRLSYTSQVVLKETTKYTGTGCTSGWYKISINNKDGFVCSKYVSTSNNITTLTASTANIRSGPGTSYSKINTLSYKDEIVLTDTTKYTGVGCSSGYYKINLNGNEGYVCSSYTQLGGNEKSNYIEVINAKSVSIRSGPGTDYSKLGSASETTYLPINDGTKYKGTGCSNGWYKITYNSKTGYICSSYTKNYLTTNKWSYRINENYATVRKTAGGDYKEIIYIGTEVIPLSTSGDYTKISYYNGKTGWIYSRLIDKYSDITKTNNSYCNTLKSKGFPSSYRPYLSYLHSKYPNWVFKAEATGITLEEAVVGELGKNYTEASNSAYLKSNTIVENPNWRIASNNFIGYMMEPRTYLTEKNIFVFEDLSYDSDNHTESVVRSIFDGTYLDTSTYANYFINAGKTYNISPVHLATRVKQEGGTNSNYDGVSGNVTTKWKVTGYVCSSYVSKNAELIDVSKVNVRSGPGTNYKTITSIATGETFSLYNTNKYDNEKGCSNGWYKIAVKKSLKGIYNYYNIGAYEDENTSSAVTRGLAAAAGFVDDLDGTPWDTREKAIKYGAKFIANGYISKGQDTMYYQKFNVGPNSTYNKFTHQYMTNILAPANESLSTYYSYEEQGLLNKALVFKIPVYKNTDSYLTTHPIAK